MQHFREMKSCHKFKALVLIMFNIFKSSLKFLIRKFVRKERGSKSMDYCCLKIKSMTGWEISFLILISNTFLFYHLGYSLGYIPWVVHTLAVYQTTNPFGRFLEFTLAILRTMTTLYLNPSGILHVFLT